MNQQQPANQDRDPTRAPLELAPFAVTVEGGVVIVSPKRFVKHWFDGNLGRWPARYAPVGLTIGTLVGVLGFVLSGKLLLELLNEFGRIITIPAGIVLVLLWSFAAFITANLPRYLRHKIKPTWVFDPSTDEVIISSAASGSRVLKFSDFDHFFINQSSITGEATPIDTYVVFGRVDGEDVVLGWFVNQPDAEDLRERLKEVQVSNRAAYEWNRKRTSNS